MYSYFLFVTLICLISGYYYSRIFPRISTVNVLFRERFLTGRFDLPGSFKNTLEVVVTDRELWLRTFWLFSGILAAIKGLHKVPLSAIRAIEIREKETTVYLINKKGKLAHFTIRFRDPKAFPDALKKAGVEVPVRSIRS